MHLWLARTDLPAPALEALEACLSNDERARVLRLRPGARRRAYLVARGGLRQILARYLDTEPEAVRIDYGKHGKPELAAPGAATGLQFNLAHSGERILYGVSLERSVGVDIQAVAPARDPLEVARRFFEPKETAVLAGLAPDARAAAFVRCWTCKEAYVKARGRGIGYGLANFRVVAQPEAPAALILDERDPDAPARWRIERVSVDPGYAAAVAAEGSFWMLRRWRWDPEPPA